VETYKKKKTLTGIPFGLQPRKMDIIPLLKITTKEVSGLNFYTMNYPH
jgi:hypothetical protein